ncbi:MAG TPA: hypothetical protein VES88_09580 [Gemmatimonadaceae bacterium]|nr:hypothetical protein [Gemmatimonadaceae bacterium]
MPLYLLVQQGTTFSTGVVAAVNRLTDFLLQYAIALAAVGALSMALIEAGKKLLDSRTKFQARRWTEWMQRSKVTGSIGPVGEAGKPWDDVTEAAARENAYTELLQLCTGASQEECTDAATDLLRTSGRIPRWHAFSPLPAHAVFGLDLGRMMGSIQEAADVALASPRQFPGLYVIMTSGADRDDVRRWFEEGAPEMANIAEKDPDDAQRKRIKEHADRFSRLRQIVKRRLDGFQLYTGDRWASWNQFSANVLGIALMLGILVWMRTTATGVTLSVPLILVVSLFGGILSPLAKDLVSALKRVKSG